MKGTLIALSPISRKTRIPNEKTYFAKENNMSKCRKPVTTGMPVRKKKFWNHQVTIWL
jgi:hypothetical protein